MDPMRTSEDRGAHGRLIPRVTARPDPCLPDHAAPGGILARHVLREFLGSRRRRFLALLENRVVVSGSRSVSRFPGSAGRRCPSASSRGHERVPVRRLVSRVALLRDRRHVGHGRRAFRGGSFRARAACPLSPAALPWSRRRTPRGSARRAGRSSPGRRPCTARG